MIPRPVLLVAAAVLVTGCISIGDSEPVDPRAYDLLPAAASTPVDAERAAIVQVLEFTVDPALDRDELVWRRGAVESGAWEHHRWARPPHEAVREVLADGLRRAGVAAVVATDPPVDNPQYVVEGHLVRCGERDEAETWYGVLELRLVVRDRGMNGTEIVRRTYAREVPAVARHPLAVVEALRTALDEVVTAATADVDAALERWWVEAVRD